MSKEMNKLKSKITRYNVIYSLFMSLIIAIFFNGTRGFTYLLGNVIAIINFNLNIYVTTKCIEGQRYKIIFVAFLRIFLAVGCTLFFIKKLDLVIFYLLGLISHIVVLIFCVIYKKGRVCNWD